jgi:hypothetical protein
VKNNKAPESSTAKPVRFRALKRLLLWGMLAVVLFFSASFAYVYTHQDEIKSVIVSSLSAQLNTEIKVGSIDIDFFSKFPQVSIRFSNVRADEALEVSEQSLFLFRGIFVRFSLWDLWLGDYTVKKLSFDNGEVNLRITKGGKENYIFWKESTGDETSADVDLQDVIFNNTLLRYRDESTDVQMIVKLDKLRIKGNFLEEKSNFDIEGNCLLQQLQANKSVYAQEVPVEFSIELLNQVGETRFKFKRLLLADLNLEASGKITSTEQVWKISAKRASIKQWNALLPREYRLHSKAWQVNGNLPASLAIVLGKERTETAIDASLSGGSFLYPGQNIELSNIVGKIKLRYTIGPRGTAGGLELTDFKASTRSGNIAFNASLKDWQKPEIQAQGSANMLVEELMNITRPGLIKEATGNVSGSFSYAAKFISWEELQENGFSKASMAGDVELSNASLTLLNSNIVLSNISAELKMKDKDLMIERLYMREGNSEFMLDGWFYDVLHLGPNRPIPRLAVRLQSQNVDLDRILGWQFPRIDEEGKSYTSSDKSDPFPINYRILLDVKKFNLIRFNGFNLKGEIWNNGPSIEGKDITLDALDGKVAGEFSWTTEQAGYLFHTKSSLNNININKLFGAFENFGQNYLLAENIYGTGTATIETSMRFDNQFNFQPASLKLLTDITIVNGRLKGYKPLESLSSMVDKKALEDVRFEKLQNQIAIDNEVIIIPQMEIKSTALSLVLKGRHSFDQQIDYSIRLALKDVISKKKKTQTDLDSWIVEVETTDQPYIWIHVGCHVDNPCLSLDRELMKKGVKTEWTQQKEDIKNIFKPEKTTEPKKDPNKGELIFEWNEEESEEEEKRR